jgi:hypothetical protein
VYETGEWPKNFIEIKMTALKKEPNATKFSDHRTYSKQSSQDTLKKEEKVGGGGKR